MFVCLFFFFFGGGEGLFFLGGALVLGGGVVGNLIFSLPGLVFEKFAFRLYNSQGLASQIQTTHPNQHFVPNPGGRRERGGERGDFLSRLGLPKIPESRGKNPSHSETNRSRRPSEPG